MSLTLDLEMYANDLVTLGDVKSEAARLEPLMVEPGSHGVHPLGQGIVCDPDFNNVQHTPSLSGG